MAGDLNGSQDDDNPLAGYENSEFFKIQGPPAVDVEVDSEKLYSIKTDETGPAPEDEADVQHCKNAPVPSTTEEYNKARVSENDEFIASGLHAIESLAPFVNQNKIKY